MATRLVEPAEDQGPRSHRAALAPGESLDAFLVREQLFDIADSGEIMPPKSTWFEPKLRDGLLTHLITD